MSSNKFDDLRMENGKLPAYAWPGGYPMFYITEDNAVLCPGCANNENGSIAYIGESPDGIEDKQWHIVEYSANWEDEDMYCEHCNKKIESAYGEA